MIHARLPFRGDICYFDETRRPVPFHLRVEASLELTFDEGKGIERVALADLPEIAQLYPDPSKPRRWPVVIDFARSLSWGDVVRTLAIIQDMKRLDGEPLDVTFDIKRFAQPS